MMTWNRSPHHHHVSNQIRDVARCESKQICILFSEKNAVGHDRSHVRFLWPETVLNFSGPISLKKKYLISLVSFLRKRSTRFLWPHFSEKEVLDFSGLVSLKKQVIFSEKNWHLKVPHEVLLNF